MSLNFYETITIRLTREQNNDIEKAVAAKPETYYNVSHFVRVAIIKELREVKKNAVQP